MKKYLQVCNSRLDQLILDHLFLFLSTLLVFDQAEERQAGSFSFFQKAFKFFLVRQDLLFGIFPLSDIVGHPSDRGDPPR